jgi:regulator of protease activity HflC (stomatin/prohibitin superfamily)
MSILCCYPYQKMYLVKEGDVGLAWHDQIPVLYGPGRHFLLSCTSQFVETRTLATAKHIQHGTIHILNVGLGEVALASDASTGLPTILSAGQHIIDSPVFLLHSFSKLLDSHTRIGELTLVRVELGDMGYGYNSDGSILLLPPGLHLIAPPARYEGKLSLQLNIVQLPESVNESKDYVQIKVKAAVYYRIVDPMKVLENVGGNFVRAQIKELGVATLQQIIRSSTLVDIAGSERVSYSGSKQSTAPQAEQGEPDFYAKVHDKFLKTLHGHILKEWGVEISNIRIENLKINDHQIAQSIAKSAIQVSELEAEHMMLDKRTKIITVRANNKAKETEIDVNAAADKVRRLAQADADAMIIKAKAERDSKILQGEGEAEYSRLVQESGLGAELATLAIHQEALKGVEQVIYVPHLPKMMGDSNPLMDSSLMIPGGRRKN